MDVRKYMLAMAIGAAGIGRASTDKTELATYYNNMFLGPDAKEVLRTVDKLGVEGSAVHKQELPSNEQPTNDSQPPVVSPQSPADPKEPIASKAKISQASFIAPSTTPWPPIGVRFPDYDFQHPFRAIVTPSSKESFYKTVKDKMKKVRAAYWKCVVAQEASEGSPAYRITQVGPRTPGTTNRPSRQKTGGTALADFFYRNNPAEFTAVEEKAGGLRPRQHALERCHW